MAKKEYKSLLIRLEPELYAAFSNLAELERRSNSNLGEVVIADYVKAQTDRKAAENRLPPTFEAEVQPNPTTTSKIKTKRTAPTRPKA
ncbi:MAG: hypothetical protein HXX08_17690 [Chloroflexi bacterium]|uniref:Uncharacterized protein n=1 Tax=Candidatus Chlorohelix allophototropha TaxID=3003348 RepID=A0A8T7M6I5_9CHLR|nr:hypothetical protein [Chloroflexota bacterium]WJW69595.1 hypothetical protein OZ401_003222 [Chloroflexota bacterium L227-S17]